MTKYLAAIVLMLLAVQVHAASGDSEVLPIHGELMIYAVDHSHPQYNRELDSKFVETTLKIGTSLAIGPHLTANLRGAFGMVRGQSSDLTFVENKTDTLLDLWNLQGEGLFGGRFGFVIGRQNFEFGDGFLVWDGVSDEVTVWTAEMRSMPGVKINWQGEFGELTLFSARTDKPMLVLDGFLGAHYGKSDLHGIHLATTDTQWGKWEVAAFLRDDDSKLEADTLALSLRGTHSPEALPALSLAGELVKEYGSVHLLAGLPSVSSQDRDAWAGHFDVTWQFSGPLKPMVKLSRIIMSGDDPTTSDYEGYDPMFIGWTDWGQWFVGSISSWEVFSTNERATLFEFGLNPGPTTRLRLQLYDIKLDREWVSGAGRNWSREVNVVFDWTPPGQVVYGLAANYAEPRSAAHAFVGDNESRLELMAWVMWFF